MSNDPFNSYFNDPENDSVFNESKDRKDLILRAEIFYEQIGLGSMQMLLYAELIAECIQIGSEIILDVKMEDVDIDEIRKIASDFAIEEVEYLSDLEITERMSNHLFRAQRKFMSMDKEFLADIFQEMKMRNIFFDFWNRFNGGLAPEI